MTAKAALCKALLDGYVLNIKNGFTLLGITNIPREIGRAVEREFGVRVDRKQREGKSRFSQPVTWVDYRLRSTPENAEGIIKMRAYVASQFLETVVKTDKELKQLQLL